MLDFMGNFAYNVDSFLNDINTFPREWRNPEFHVQSRWQKLVIKLSSMGVILGKVKYWLSLLLTHNTWNIWRVAASLQILSYLLRLVRTDRRLISCSYPNSNMNATAGSSYLGTHSPRPWLRNTTANYGPLLSLCSMGKWDVFFGQTNYFRSDSADGVDKIVSFVLYCLCVQNKLL